MKRGGYNDTFLKINKPQPGPSLPRPSWFILLLIISSVGYFGYSIVLGPLKGVFHWLGIQ